MDMDKKRKETYMGVKEENWSIADWEELQQLLDDYDCVRDTGLNVYGEKSIWTLDDYDRMITQKMELARINSRYEDVDRQATENDFEIPFDRKVANAII